MKSNGLESVLLTVRTVSSLESDREICRPEKGQKEVGERGKGKGMLFRGGVSTRCRHTDTGAQPRVFGVQLQRLRTLQCPATFACGYFQRV